MELFDFFMLNSEEKKSVVLHEGVLIGKRKTPEVFVFLFDLDKFYVETFCSLNTKEVVEYRMFQQTALLQPYLETIAIDNLLRE